METANRGVSSRLMRVYLVWLGVVMVAALLTTVVVVPQVSQLRFFRMAPFSIVLAEMDRARLESLEKEFAVDYVVFRRPFDVRQVKGPQVQGKIAFLNDSYLVLKVQDETIACGAAFGASAATTCHARADSL